MAAIAQQPTQGQVNHALMDGTREWSTGVCGCASDIKSCLCAMCCMPCMLCSLASRMNESCCVPFIFGNAGIAALRVKLRTAYGIKGSICGDMCSVIWCGACVACQLSREMDHVGL